MKSQELLADACSVCSTKLSGSHSFTYLFGQNRWAARVEAVACDALSRRLLKATVQRENSISLQSPGALLRDSSSPPH